MKTAVLSLPCIALFCLITCSSLTSQETVGPSAPDCVILAQADDPFVSLARSIAEEEGFPFVHNTDEALNLHPEYLIWVASPDRLNESTLMAFGRNLGNRNTGVALGIITGSTIEQARALWERKPKLPIDRFAYISLADGIFLDTDKANTHHDFTVPEIQKILLNADYIHYSGHGTARGWSEFRSDSIPDSLKPIIVSAASCETFRPFVPDNIALRFIDNGAAAYVGFAWSPAGDYFMGDYGGFPFCYAWPGCSLGHIVQIINQGTLKTFARFPQCFLLGDPRIFLHETTPYRIVSDETVKTKRTIVYRDCPKGIVPFRIPDGGTYDYVAAAGISAAGRNDLFYNSRLQQVDIGSDKFILVQSDGGDMTLTLRTHTPVLFCIQDTLSDFLDSVVPVRDNQSVLKLIGLFLILPFAVWRALRQRLPLSDVMVVIAVGVVIDTSEWLYAVFRVDAATVSAVPIHTGFIPYAVDALLIAGVGLFFITARSWWVKGFALLWSSFPVVIVPALIPLGLIVKHIRHIPDYAHIHTHLTLLVAVIVKAGLLLTFLLLSFKWAAVFTHTTHKRSSTG